MCNLCPGIKFCGCLFLPLQPGEGEGGSTIYRKEDGVYLYYHASRWWVGQTPGTEGNYRSEAGASPALPPRGGWEVNYGSGWESSSMTVEYGVARK